MDRQIAEVRSLATKYSKAELGRMVQMGVLDPQRAMMAGMMIDRIQKQNAQPPQTTVAEDVLGLPGAAQQEQMQPTQQPQPAGVEALPAGNVGEYAGGGIVAFAGGGDTDIPGYAGRDASWVIDPAVQRQRDVNWALPIRMKELEEARASGDPALIAAAERQVRQIVGNKPSLAGGITDLLPSAQAGEAQAAPAGDTSSAFGRGVKRLMTPFPKSTYASGLETYDKRLSEVNNRLGELGGTLGMRQQTPEQQAEFEQLMGDRRVLMNARNNLAQDMSKYNMATVTKPGGTPAEAPPKAEVTEVPATGDKEAPATVDKEAPPAQVAEEPKPRRPDAIKAEQITVPTAKNVKDEIAQVREAYKEAGVDTDMYQKMMADLKEKKVGLGERKKQALGFALMSVGLGITGAKKGQEFAALGAEGQKALGTYMNSMERIVENEQQLDMLNRQLAMAENNFKRTGADSALAQVRAREERIEQIEAKNVELRQAANTAQAQVGATVYGAELGADVRKDIVAMQVAGRVEAAKATAGRAGALTQKQEYDIRQQLKMELEPKLREQYKRLGSEAQINKKVKEELDKIINSEIGQIRSRSAGYGGGAAPQDMFADWSVEGM